MPFFFPKSARLCLSQDFRNLRKDSIQKVGYYLLVSLRSTEKQTRVGITASKKFGKAHDRNRFKRLVRESFRLSINPVLEGFDIEVIPKKTARLASFQEIRNELITLCILQDELSPVI